MDYALLLVFTAAIAVGVVSAVVRTWALHRRLYSVEDELSTVQGILTREVKIRAATSRQRSTPAEDAIAAAIANPPQPHKHVPWWNNPALKKGAYPS